MLFNWFNTKEVDAFADSVVAELQERFPPTGVDLSTKKSVERVMKNVDRLMQRVAEFSRERRLNLYKKARFGNRIKWALKEAKYPPLFVDVLTHELVTQLTLAPRKPPSSP
jgi:hypothetical protein